MNAVINLKNIFFISILFSFYACECVPTMETEKEIIPTQFGHIAFINSLGTKSSINISYNSTNIINNLFLDSKDSIYDISLNKITKGFSNIKIFQLDTFQLDTINLYTKPILSFGVNIEQGENYSAVIYKKNSMNTCLFLCDSFSLSKKNYSQFRLINLSNDSLFIYIDDELISMCLQYGYTKVYALNLIKKKYVMIKDAKNKVLFSISSLNLYDDSMYNIIYKNKDSVFICRYSFL